MTKKQHIVTLAVGAVIIAALAFIVVLELTTIEQPVVNQPELITTIDQEEETVADTRPRDWEETEFRRAVPVDIKVPEKGDEMPDDLKDVIAVPEVSVVAAPGTSAKSRSFVIKAENNQFTPENIIVNMGDIVQVTFQAVDKDYDIIFTGYNMMQTAKQGEIKPLSFQASQDGRFVYYCEICGGIESSARGEIIVVK